MGTLCYAKNPQVGLDNISTRHRVAEPGRACSTSELHDQCGPQSTSVPVGRDRCWLVLLGYREHSQLLNTLTFLSSFKMGKVLSYR